MGSGVNSFALWCEFCGAVVHHAHDFGRKIKGLAIKYDFEEV